MILFIEMSRLLRTVQRVVREIGPTLPGPEGATLSRMEILEASKGETYLLKLR